MASKITEAELLQELEKHISNLNDGSGLTCMELAEQFGYSDAGIRKILRKLWKAGKIEVGKARREGMDGAMYPVPVYKLKVEVNAEQEEAGEADS